MRNIGLFLTLFLSIYTMTNLYLFRHIHLATVIVPWIRPILYSAWLFVLLAYPLGRILGRLLPYWLGTAFLWIGALYLGFLTYALLLALMTDLYRLCSSLAPALLRPLSPAGTTHLWLWGGVGIGALLLLGYINALTPRIRLMEMTLPTPLGSGPEQLRLAVVTDIHAGEIIHNARLQHIFQRVNETKPDAVLLVGDIVDGLVRKAEEAELAEELQKLDAPLGVYAVTGNHEYYAGIEEALAYIEKGNVRILQDESVVLADRLLLVGRNDRQAPRFGHSRKSLETLLAESSAPADLPVVVLDHTPLDLDEAADTGVSLQFSGHTHNGQLFPFNLITRKIYEQSWGMLRKKKTIFYVSCGVGTWGPPFRTSSVPEIVLCTLTFSEPQTAAVQGPP